MYFPYFRGRQYELLALRELAKSGLHGNQIIPVVEPVKFMATFDGTLKVFNDARLPIAIIFNPAVGGLVSAQDTVAQLLRYLGDNPFIIPAVLMNKSGENVLGEIIANNFSEDKILVILNNHDSLDTYKNIFCDTEPRYTLFPDTRHIRRTVNQNKVLFEDKFNKQSKNEDYLKFEDEFFSEDHLFFSEEGYTGFGDYSIIGNEFVEGGFAPKAVAIHIVYFAENNSLRIRHFVSDTNIDISDVAGKFYEAVTKLADWYYSGQLQRQTTTALKTLLDYHQKGYYPGLPTLKKLSIMHHLELMGKYLDGSLDK